MKNKILLVFLAVALVVSLAAFAACKAEEEPPVVDEEEPPVVEEVWEWPKVLAVQSHEVEQAVYGAMIGWTTPLAADTGMRIRVVAEANPFLRYTQNKEGVFFCFVIGGDFFPMIRADRESASRAGGPWQVRIVYPSAKTDMGYAVRGDSGIKTPYDIKPGTKIMWYSFMGESAKDAMKALLAWGQVDPEDVEWVPAGSPGISTKYLQDGKGDIFYSFPAWPMMYEAEAAPHGLAWIELDSEADPEGAKRYLEINDTTFGVMTTGVPSAQGVPGITSISSFGKLNTEPELVYNVVKWLDENYDKYKDAHPFCEFMTIDNLMGNAERGYIPLHDGLIRYLEEIGRWTPAHEARRQQNIDLLTRYVDAYQAAIDEADEKGIKVDPENEEWVELWYSRRSELPEFKSFPGLD